MMYVVCYDVSDDAARARLAKVLLDFGSRVQESVFECPLDEGLVERMIARLQRVSLAETDRVRVYRLCGGCLEHVEIFGVGNLTQEPDFYLV